VNLQTSNSPSAERQASEAYPIKTFKDRDAWIRLMLAIDVATLSHGAKILGVRVALHLNVETGQCNPSMAMLAEGSGTSDSTVRRMLHELEREGWLGIDRSQGRHANSFELRTPTLSTGEGVQPCQQLEGFNNINLVNSWKGNPVKSSTPTLSTGDRQKSESRTANRKAKDIDSLQLDLDEDSGRRHRQTPDDIESKFEEWWKQYPRRVSKGAALKIYRRIITKGEATPAELLAGAMRYAAERSGQDPKYTKHPATWLHGQCWQDEPAAPITGTIDHNGNQVATAPPPNRPPPQWRRESNTERLMRKLQGGV
jgi:helix-turn-helix protein